MDGEAPQNGDKAVDFVEVLVTDVSGIRRCRTFTAKQVPRLLNQGFGFAKVIYFLPPFADVPPPNGKYFASGEFCIKPDMSTFTRMPWRKNAGVVFGDAYTENDDAAAESPRHILKRTLAMLKQEFGYDMKIGFETEFNLLSKKDQQNGLPAPLVKQNYGSQNDNVVHAEVMEDIVTALEAQGIEVLHFHPESAYGQYEIATGPADPVKACDQALLTRFTIVSVAEQYGFEACFLPKLFDMCAGNGNHVHMSLSKDGVDVSQGTEPRTLAPPAQHFISGLLSHQAAYMIWTAGMPNSFERYQPSCWSSAYTAWGVNNREALVRVVYPTKDSQTGIAAVIMAGILGLRASSPLPPGTESDPRRLSEQEREEKGMKRYPKSIHDAIDQFNANKNFRDLLVEVSSEDFVTSVLATRKSLADHFTSSDGEIKSLYNTY